MARVATHASSTPHPVLPPLQGRRRLVIVGGSDGSDLLRDGVELYAAPDPRPENFSINTRTGVHCLSVGCGAEAAWAWASLVVRGDTALAARVGGRCHAACLVGERIVCFGGGADLSASLAYLDVSEVAAATDEELHGLLPSAEVDSSFIRGRAVVACGAPEVLSGPVWVGSERFGWSLGQRPTGPSGRLSAAAVRAGTRLLIHGGWSGDADGLSDMHALELDAALGVSGTHHADAAADGSHAALTRALRRHVGPALTALVLSVWVYVRFYL
jgi:hypothetical protein